MQNDPYIAAENGKKRLSLSNETANRIVEKIRKDAFPPGSRLPSEFELAEEFGVSRGTIREAVKLLVSKDVLEIRPAKGTFVRENPGMSEDPLGLAFMQDNEKMIRDLLDLRILLECYAAKNACQERLPTCQCRTDRAHEGACGQDRRGRGGQHSLYAV